jgi:GMP synthase-like glutamine amidotransferase
MHIHWLQHVPFEGLGAIETWAQRRGHSLSATRLYAGDPLPEVDSFAMLVVMGGPMGIYDEQEYPWLSLEKSFLQTVIGAEKPVLGICLGAQLVADVLGGRVRANKDKEIGWFPVTRAEEIPNVLKDILPRTQTVFHWHGDTFELPAQSVRLYASEACRNQAFVYKDRVVSLQFHLETTTDSARLLVDNCRHELVAGSPWIQAEQEIAEGIEKNPGINQTMDRILDYLATFSK